MTYKLLSTFESVFKGQAYRHRNSTRGDHIASFLIDHVVSLSRSPKLAVAVQLQSSVLNTRNTTVGKSHRRGDGTFGAAVPGVPAINLPGLVVSLGEVATVELGAEVKILAKAMIEQLDRVGTDMINQADEFRKHGNGPICVGIVGINRASIYLGLEGEREWLTDGKKHKHPNQEAAQAEQRLINRVASHFDEVMVLRFIATNMPPYDFAWVDQQRTAKEYGASLVRISSLYEKKF